MGPRVLAEANVQSHVAELRLVWIANALHLEMAKHLFKNDTLSFWCFEYRVDVDGAFLKWEVLQDFVDRKSQVNLQLHFTPEAKGTKLHLHSLDPEKSILNPSLLLACGLFQSDIN